MTGATGGVALQSQAAADEGRLTVDGIDHPVTLQTLGNLGVAYRTAGQLDQAIKLHEQLRDIKIKKFGADHPETLAAERRLAKESRTRCEAIH